MEKNKIYNLDCLEGMREIPDKSIDCIICDLPYNYLDDQQWDSVIDYTELWKQYKRIIKDRRAIVLFAEQRFSAKLILSNETWYKYKWIWIKNRASGFLHAKQQPMRISEEIVVFYKKQCLYNPQLKQGYKINCLKNSNVPSNYIYGNRLKELNSIKYRKIEHDERYPDNILFFNNERGLHPTQKPVALMEYLIQTYSNPGDTILDNCMGSGTTAIACIDTNRNYIGFELNENYYNLAIKRIENHCKGYSDKELKRKLDDNQIKLF